MNHSLKRSVGQGAGGRGQGSRGAGEQGETRGTRRTRGTRERILDFRFRILD
ncbi:MAG: hypothetical protein ACRAVC_14220 [Trichormus sp.]